MEEYHRDSLRELRRAEQETAQKPRQRGSVLITVLIILLFLGAGCFYIKTEKPEVFQKYYNTLKNWASDAVSVFQPEEIRQTVDAALAEQDAEG